MEIINIECNCKMLMWNKNKGNKSKRKKHGTRKKWSIIISSSYVEVIAGYDDG